MSQHKHLAQDTLKTIFESTNGHCHICGEELDRANWNADHVNPLARGGSQEIDNYLPACGRCNGLRWHNYPETIRRILFLGVIANRKGYKLPFSHDAHTIREMRAKRLLDNWKRRRGSDKSKTNAYRDGFSKFEAAVAKRMKTKDDKWRDVVLQVLNDPGTPGEWIEAYRELVKEESPGEVELLDQR